MNHQQTIKLILNTAGYEVTNYELERNASGVVYTGEACNKAGDTIEFSEDSFGKAISSILTQIYATDEIEFVAVED